jgi:Kef-type K+ transport system membrane component KefB
VLSKILIDLAIILVGAQAVGAVFAMVGQPPVIGQIVAGILLGPSLLGLAPGDPSATLFPPGVAATLKTIGQLGLLVYMFTVGWDLDVVSVRRQIRSAGAVSLTSIALPFALGLALADGLYPDYRGTARIDFWQFALFIGASLSITAFPVLARILEERGMAKSSLGTLVLAAAALGDALGWTVVAVVLAAVTSGGASEYVRVVAEALVFGVGMLWVVGPVLRRLLRDPNALRARSTAGLTTVLAGLLVSGYLTEKIGIHAVFGAFLFGAVLPRWEGAAALTAWRRALAPIITFLLPVYFVTSGLAVDTSALNARDVMYLGVVLATAVVGKFGGAFAAARATGMDVRTASTVGVLMNTRGLIEIVLLTIGLDSGIIDRRLFTILVLMALVTTVLAPPLVRRLHPDATR